MTMTHNYCHVLTQHNRHATLDKVNHTPWIVACLCANWCDTCGTYRDTFDQLALKHPGAVFVWIDIEDNADLVDDLEIDNFPTIILQRQDTVVFFGTVLPDINVVDRLILAQFEQAHLPHTEYAAAQHCNLRTRLKDILTPKHVSF